MVKMLKGNTGPDQLGLREPLAFPLDITPSALMLLVLSLALSLVASLYKRIWIDELLEYFTDRQPVVEILRTQLHRPFSLEPPLFHLIVHGFQVVLGGGVQVQRMPAMLCFLLAQYCIYCIVRGLAGERAALVGLLLPTLMYARHYSNEGRSYALLLAMGTASLLCWYRATQRCDGQNRRMPLLWLGVSLAVAVMSHYYGVLLLAPVGAAEAIRTIERRRWDWPVVAAVAGGGLSLLLDLPFVHAALGFKAHYYAQRPTLQTIFDAYDWMLGIARAKAVAGDAVVLLFVPLLLLVTWRVMRVRRDEIAVWAAPVALAMVPVFAFLLGRYVTQAFEPRYTIASAGGLSILLAVAISPLLAGRFAFWALIGVVLLLSVGLGMHEINRYRREFAEFHQQLQMPTDVVDGSGVPKQPIYVRSVELFLLAHYYLQPQVADRFTLLYSMNLEYGWLHHDAGSHFARNIGAAYPKFQTMSYEEFRKLAGEKQVLVANPKFTDVDEWLAEQMTIDGIELQPVGHLLYGTLYTVHGSASAVR